MVATLGVLNHSGSEYPAGKRNPETKAVVQASKVSRNVKKRIGDEGQMGNFRVAFERITCLTDSKDICMPIATKFGRVSTADQIP